MVPLTTRQGLAADELRALIGGREVVVWGSGDLALDVLTSLGKAGVAPRALLHSQPAVVGRRRHGLPLCPAAATLEAGDPRRLFVVLAAAAYHRQAEAACLAAGWCKNVDFVSHLSISRPQAIVEVANVCALRCLGCARDTVPDLGRSGLMSAMTFQAVLAKLDGDLPLLSHLELALSGEPLAHPELATIVRLAETVVPCTVATSLAGDVPLDAIVAAAPSRFDITAFGFAEGYERAMPGASWAVFLVRLAELRAAIVKHRPTTRFQVRRYRLRDDPPDIDAKWRALLHGSGIALSPQLPYLMPYEHVLAHARGEMLPVEAARAAAALPWDIDRALAGCAADAHLPCLSQRVFPVIRVDRSVALCHLYQQPVVAADYLAIAWDELLHRRHQVLHCTYCQSYGLHRLDIEVLARRHPELVSGHPPGEFS